MATVKSTAEIKRDALARGVSVTLSGETFNAEKRKVPLAQQKLRSFKRRESKPTTPAPEPVVVEVIKEPAGPLPAPIINIDMEKFTSDNAAMLAAITEAVKVQQPAPKPTEWQFDIQRDDRGFIKSMTAKAK